MRYYHDKVRSNFDSMGKPVYEYVIHDRENPGFWSYCISEATAMKITNSLNNINNEPCRRKIISSCDFNALRKSIVGKVVFTNGCFRLLHAGHVFLLRWAKEQGSVLVVGVNSDKSVSKIKEGCFYPIDERMEILAAMEMVDYVVPFDEDTPWELIEELKPDVLVKGHDNLNNYIPGSDLVRDVRIAPESPWPDRHASKIMRSGLEQAFRDKDVVWENSEKSS